MPPETYTIEPPEDRRRDLTVNRKLDQIIGLLRHPEPTEGAGNDVIFEPDVDQLPVVAAEAEADAGDGTTDDSGQGEGSANVDEGSKRPRFSFPGRRQRGQH